ncbi:MAG: hypothetical protein ACFFC1_11575, partial [Promethearchaeota archaeon]
FYKKGSDLLLAHKSEHLRKLWLLKVKIDGGSGQTIKELTFTSKSGWNYEFSAIMIFMFISSVSIGIIIFNYSRIHIEKLKQRVK